VFQVLSLSGIRPYKEVWELQKQLVEKRVRDECADTLIFCEHSPVVTRGRGLQKDPNERERAVPLVPLPIGVDYYEVERGGDLTYHAPGQLVAYPIFKLIEGGPGPVGMIRFLEDGLIRVLIKHFDLIGESRPHATGVWVGEKKVASVGIAVRGGVLYHGMAVNVFTNLKGFNLISPCGFTPDVMTSLEVLVPDLRTRVGEDWRGFFERELTESYR
jgi:lipoyl(octanoyl) transferase